MEKENKVSIIVPAYNVEKYIEACIDSVKKQTCQDFECVIVDDGSTDNTLSLIQKMIENDKRFKLYHQENLGVSAARNTAISHATGAYLVFLDGDDLLQEDAVSIVRRDIEVDEKEDLPDVILYSMMSYYERPQSDGNVKIIIRPREWHLDKIDCSGVRALRDCIYKNNFMFAVWQTVVKRSYIQNNSYEFKSGIVHEDELWLMRVIGNANNVKMGSKAFYLNRGGRTGGITQAHDIQKEYDKCTVIQELQKDLSGNLKKNQELTQLVKEKCAQLEFSLICKYREYASEDIDKRLKKQIKSNCKKLCGSNNGKYKIIWLLCTVVGVNITSKFVALTGGK